MFCRVNVLEQWEQTAAAVVKGINLPVRIQDNAEQKKKNGQNTFIVGKYYGRILKSTRLLLMNWKLPLVQRIRTMSSTP